jgi:hypothetical protein
MVVVVLRRDGVVTPFVMNHQGINHTSLINKLLRTPSTIFRNNTIGSSTQDHDLLLV